MSNAIVLALGKPFERVWSLVVSYVDGCPDNIWAEKNGGWPVWQQMVHSIAVADWLVCGEGEKSLPMPCERDAAMLKIQGNAPVSQAAVKDYAVAVKTRVDAWLACLDDDKLPELNTTLTKAIGRDIPFAVVVLMLSSHTNYHLGACDAALRDHGLPGVC